MDYGFGNLLNWHKLANDIMGSHGSKKQVQISPKNAEIPGLGGMTRYDVTPEMPTAPAAPQQPPAQLPPPSDSGGGGVSLPALAQFLQPYVDAQATAQKAHDQALPDIASQYAQLRTTLGQHHDEAQKNLAQAAGLALQERQQLQDHLTQQTQPAINDLQAQLGGQAPASVVNGVAATNALQQQNLALQGQRADQLNSTIQAQYNSSNAARTADTQLQETAAKTAADQNLQKIIDSIAMKKGDVGLQYAQMQAELAQKQASGGISPELQYRMQQDQMKSQEVTPRLQLMQNSQQFSQNYPTEWGVFQDLVSANGGDTAGMISDLKSISGDLQKGKFKSGLTGQKFGKADANLIGQWITEYGDNKSKFSVDSNN